MSQFSQSRQIRRAPRASLRPPISVSLRLENGRNIAARLHQFSLTGGMLELPSCIEERVWVGLTFPVGFGIVHLTAEMMFPMRATAGYFQPFRITCIRPEDLQILDKEITEILKRPVAANPRPGLAHGQGSSPPRFLFETF